MKSFINIVKVKYFIIRQCKINLESYNQMKIFVNNYVNKLNRKQRIWKTLCLINVNSLGYLKITFIMNDK